MLIVLLLITYRVFYAKLNVLFWFIVIILVISSNISNRHIMFYYLLSFSVVMLAWSILFTDHEIIVLDRAYYISLFLILFFIMMNSYAFNRLYRKIVDQKITRYKEISGKNEEITSLYEEILASEEELKEQNEKLNVYNTEINANKERLEFLAYNDTLTGLPNRKMLIEQLHVMVELDVERHHPFAVVFIDLDNFKKINDSLGHAAGDMLLIKVANRMDSVVHKNDLLGRLGGDELALIVRRNLPGEDLLAYVQALCDLFDETFQLEDVNMRISASFGVAVYPEDGRSVEDLLKAADTAMYKAKEIGKNNVQFYDKKMKNDILLRIELEDKLIHALENDEFYLEYQPLFDTKTKKILGLEALIRWKTEDQARIEPSDFIPFAEETGLIGEIGEWVLKTVCQKIKELEELGLGPVKISVNISAVQMAHDAFIERTKKIIEESQVDPRSLEFEITESIFIRDKQQAIDRIMALKRFGIKISMDDFGTGYSSLSYLMELPIDRLKIDRSFIKAIENDASKNQIISSIINMVHALDMKVVAEGIETKMQLDYLERESCDLLQGFLLSYPLEGDEIDRLLRDQKMQHEDITPHLE